MISFTHFEANNLTYNNEKMVLFWALKQVKNVKNTQCEATRP